MIWIITIFLFIIFLFGLSKKIKFSNYFFYGENLKKLKTKLGLFFVLAMIILFIYVLLESFFRYRLVLNDFFVNRRPEYRLRGYVFGHRYQSEIYFRSASLKN